MLKNCSDARRSKAPIETVGGRHTLRPLNFTLNGLNGHSGGTSFQPVMTGKMPVPPESSIFNAFWIPTFVGMTKKRQFSA